MKIILVLLSCVFILQGCSSVRQVERVDIRPGFICGTEGFTQSPIEHIVDEIKQPIIVRAVKGQITNEQGGWPRDTSILFEIREIGGLGGTAKTYADSEGSFCLPDVAEGRYCFKITVLGWQSVIGIIQVDRRANAKDSILIVMKIGV
jgi:hypothetical protein